jgi:hypothetical protein
MFGAYSQGMLYRNAHAFIAVHFGWGGPDRMLFDVDSTGHRKSFTRSHHFEGAFYTAHHPIAFEDIRERPLGPPIPTCQTALSASTMPLQLHGPANGCAGSPTDCMRIKRAVALCLSLSKGMTPLASSARPARSPR